jgi:hypothetical protein
MKRAINNIDTNNIDTNNIDTDDILDDKLIIIKPHKIFRSSYDIGNIILINDSQKIRYSLSSEENIFSESCAKFKCPFCENNICEYIKTIQPIFGKTTFGKTTFGKKTKDKKFIPINMENHLKNNHSDKVICVKNIKLNKKKQFCEFIIIKKIVL